MVGIFVSVAAALGLAAATAQAPAAFDQSVRAKLVDAVGVQLGHYTFEEKIATLRSVIVAHRAKYLAIDDPKAFGDAVSDDLYAVAHDKHLRVFYSPNGIPPDRDPSAAEVAHMHQAMAYSNAGYHTIAHLPGNIGYIKLDGFAPMPDAKAAIDNTMQGLAATDALIFDLRANRGGDPDSLDYLLGYFFKKPVELTSIFMHAPGERDELVKQFSASHVGGRRYVDKPIYVLTSSETISCAEQFSYDMQTLHRARIIGETTAGGANPGGMFPLDAHFALFVPQGRAINPYTRRNWEGTGVVPDEPVSAGRALVTAYAEALRANTNPFDSIVDARRRALADPEGALKAALPGT